MTIYVVGVLMMFVIYVIVGNYAGRRVKEVEDYYVAGRNGNTLLIVGSLIASYLSTVAFMGEVGFSYDGYLLPFLFMYVTCSTGYYLGARFFGRYIRRVKVLTIPQFFGDRFQSKRIQILAGIVTIVGISSYLVAVSQGTALLLSEIMGTSYLVSLLITWAIYISVSLYAGSRGVLITETLMFGIFTVMALISVPYISQNVGGWKESIIQAVLIPEKPGLYDWHGVVEGDFAYMGTPFDVGMWIVALSIIWIIVISISPWQASRYLMARDEHVVMRSGIIAPVMAVLVVTLIHFSVTSINVLDFAITPSERVYISTAIEYFPVWLGIIVCGGILSAGLSSCITFITLIGFSLSNDVYEKLSGKNNHGISLKGSRIAMAIVGFIVLVITYFQPPAVMWISYFAATLFGVSWAVIGFMAVWSKKITEQGAFWSMVAGIASFVGFKLVATFGDVYFAIRPELLSLAISLIVVFIVNSFTKVTEAQIQYRNEMHIVPPELSNPADIKTTMVYPKIAIGFGLALIVIMYFIYYVPYQEAISML